MFPPQPARRAGRRMFLEGVLWIVRTGAPWRELPAVFGHWSEKGVFERVSRELSADADFGYAMVDGTIVRLHRHVAGAPKKNCRPSDSRGAGAPPRGGAAAGIVAPTDAPGNPVRFALLPGQRHELPAVAPLPTRAGSSGC